MPEITTHEITALMPITVLIVDDHPIVRKALTNMLEKQSDIEVVGPPGTGWTPWPKLGNWRPISH